MGASIGWVKIQNCIESSMIAFLYLQGMNDERIVNSVDFSEFEKLFQTKTGQKSKADNVESKYTNLIM